ncbi:MAG: glutamyl-tRNA reductase, partial [Chloroflexota bacterium]
MELIAVCANYKSCPAEVREDLLREWVTDKLFQLRPLLQEAVMLDTCHRVEVYGLVVEQDSVDAALAFLGAGKEGAYHYRGEAVMRHLFRVSAGLDSLIPGETQVLGQVRQTMAKARQERLIGPVLSALFRQAITCGKQVRSQARLTGQWATLGTAAAELAQRTLGTLDDKSALLLGAGKTTEMAALALHQRGIAKLWLASRTQSRAEVAARRFGADSIPIEDMERALAQCHLLISATTAPHPIVSRSAVEAAMRGRDFPLCII